MPPQRMSKRYGTPPPAHTSRTPPDALIKVVDAAIAEFAERGFTATRLDRIASVSGMSKRMIHYHYTDKSGLYHHCVDTALTRVLPDSEDLDFYAKIAIDEIRMLIDAIFATASAYPTEVKLLAAINTDKLSSNLLIESQDNIAEVTRKLNKLMIRGQDTGAFRPGISTPDVFFLIMSLMSGHITQQVVMKRTMNVDIHSAENIKGTHHIMVDAVIAFLTANFAATDFGEQEAYLDETSLTEGAADIYAT